tara:strand:- start:1884 stop:2087 length:204 start_codon:yes stop_codon:yes gene_type:complete
MKNQLDTLEQNINFWSKIVEQQEYYIMQDTDQFPHSWTEYVHAKTQLERVAKKFGTTEVWEIKDLYR